MLLKTHRKPCYVRTKNFIFSQKLYSLFHGISCNSFHTDCLISAKILHQISGGIFFYIPLVPAKNLYSFPI